MNSRVRIGTRGSQLARMQTDWIADRIRAAFPDIEIAITIIKTTGDRVTDRPLASIGGKGLFTKELETALLDNDIDLAVHSLKDLPTELPEGLVLGAIPVRESPFDALVCAQWETLTDLPAGARVGTSSLRRAAQLRAALPGVQVVDLRGNVDTRLRRVADGDLDAAILACAGLRRIGRADAIRQAIPAGIMMPAVGQGALAIECRAEDPAMQTVLAALHHGPAAAAVTAERALLAALEGGCQVPLGALAVTVDDEVRIDACVCSGDGSTVLRATAGSPISSPERAGLDAAESLLRQGAGDLIAALR